MATTRRTRSYRGGSRRTSGSGALIDTVRNTITQISGNRGSTKRGGNLASKASGLIGGLLSGNGGSSRGRGRGGGGGRRRRR